MSSSNEWPFDRPDGNKESPASEWPSWTDVHWETGGETVPLSERQAEAFHRITASIQDRGFAPSVRELQNAMGIRSPNGMMCHLKALERKGWISRDANTSRGIRLLRGHVRPRSHQKGASA